MLEEQLRPYGLTARFFPQSFTESTVGGWVATRAAGHFATGPTRIDEMVQVWPTTSTTPTSSHHSSPPPYTSLRSPILPYAPPHIHSPNPPTHPPTSTCIHPRVKQALRMATPTGVVATPLLPASGAGPDPKRLLLGSEGTLGVVTEIVLKVRPRARVRVGLDRLG